jgi:hypothetical protein
MIKNKISKNLKIRILIIGIYLGFSISNLGFTRSAKAQSALGLTAIPPRLEISINPGQVISKEIKVRNESNVERFVTTSTKDFVVVNDLGTPIEIDAKSTEQNRWAASNWLQVSETNLKLKPGETKSLILTIIAPDNATPGGHYAMVLHSPNNEAVLSETGSTILTNVGSLVYITVAGPTNQEARITEFTGPNFQEYGPVNFRTTINNLSDIHIAPVGEITIKDWLNQKTQLPLESINIFPYTNRTYENQLNRKWLFGRYQADLTAGYGSAGGVLTATLFFWIVPWRLIILTLVAIVLVAIIIKLLIRQDPPSTQIEELEKELDSLKNKYKDK